MHYLEKVDLELECSIGHITAYMVVSVFTPSDAGLRVIG